jgi:cell division protein FtsB
MGAPPRISVTTLILLGFIAYFSVHGLTGKQGVGAMMALTEEENALAHELAVLKRQEAVLAEEVRRLSEPTLDLDLLEERAREVLNAAAPDETLTLTAASIGVTGSLDAGPHPP